jgi:hypothetical protein
MIKFLFLFLIWLLDLGYGNWRDSTAKKPFWGCWGREVGINNYRINIRKFFISYAAHQIPWSVTPGIVAERKDFYEGLTNLEKLNIFNYNKITQLSNINWFLSYLLYIF